MSSRVPIVCSDARLRLDWTVDVNHCQLSATPEKRFLESDLCATCVRQVADDFDDCLNHRSTDESDALRRVPDKIEI